MKLKNLRKTQKGQVLVELALGAMIFVILGLSTFDVARVLQRHHQFTQLAREGARFASQTVNATTSGSNLVEARIIAIRDLMSLNLKGGSFTITGVDPNGDGAADLITISVEQTFKDAFGAAFIPGLDAMNINPSVTMPTFVTMAPGAKVINL